MHSYLLLEPLDRTFLLNKYFFLQIAYELLSENRWTGGS